MEEPPYLNVNMDLHPECRISNYLFQIQKITGPFSDFQLDCFKDLSENQEIKIRTADTKRETRELMENARNKKSKSRPAWLSPRELEINYYEASGDQGCGPFSSYKMTDNGLGTYTERTVRKCCHHYHSPRKENHQPETVQRKDATTTLDDLVSKYFSKKTKEEVTQTDNIVRTGGTQTEYKAMRTGATQTEATDLKPLDLDKLKDLMKKAVRRVKDTSVVSVEEFLKLCIDEVELNSIKDQVKKAKINLDLNGKLDANYGNEEMSAFDARMLSVIDATLAVCRDRLREFPTQARKVTPRRTNVAQSKDFRSFSETSSEITDQLYHQCGGENDRYKYEERDVRQERSVKEPYVTTKANEQLYKDVREMYREHAENESMPHTSQKRRKADDSKKRKKKERHKPELENSTPISHPSTLSYYMQESARPINWVVEESDRDFLDDHYKRDVLAVPRLDLDFTREDDPVELSAHSSSSSYWSEASKESMRDWLKSKGIEVFNKDDWDEISVFSSPDKAKENKDEQETVDVSKKRVLQQVNQKMQVAADPRQDLNSYVDSSSSDDSSLLNSSDRELFKTQCERTGRWALATHKYMDLKQMRGDIDEMFHDSESSVMSDRGSSVLTDWTSLSQRKSNRYDEGNGRENDIGMIGEIQVGKETMHGNTNNFERLHLENFSDVSDGRQPLSTIEEVSSFEEEPYNVHENVSVCNEQSDWSNEKLSFTSSEKGQIDAFVSKDDKIDMNLTYQERFEERRQKAIDDLLAPDTSEEEFEVPDRQTQLRKPEVSKKSRQQTMPPVKLSIEAQMSISIGGNIESISSLGSKESKLMMMTTDSSSESDESEFYRNKTAVVQNKGLHMESSKRKEQFMKQHTKESAYIDDELESRQEDKRGVTKARSKRSCEKGYNVVEQIQRDNNTDNEKMLAREKETKAEHKHKLEADNAKPTKHQVETVENKKPSSVKQSMNDTKKPVNRGVDVEYGQDVQRAKEEKNQNKRRLSETKNEEKTGQEEMNIEVATKMTKRTDITRHEMPGSVTKKKSYQENCKLKGASNQNIDAKQFKEDAQNTDIVNNKSETLRMGRSKKKDKTGKDERKHENNQDIATNINDSKMLVSKRAEQTNGHLEHTIGTRVQSESCDRRLDKVKRKSNLHSEERGLDDKERINLGRKQKKPNETVDLFKEYALECMDEPSKPSQTRNENDATAIASKKHKEQNLKGMAANESNKSYGGTEPQDKPNKVSDDKRMKSEHYKTKKMSTSDYQKYPFDVMQPVHKHKTESKERSEKQNVEKNCRKNASVQICFIRKSVR